MPRRPLGATALAISSMLMAVPAAAMDSESGVDVTDAGDEPRTELRYEWTPGLTGTTVTQADGSIVTMLNGIAASDEQAALEMIVSRTVTEVDDEGNARVEFSVQAPARDEPRVEIPAAEMLPSDVSDVLWAELASLSRRLGRAPSTAWGFIEGRSSADQRLLPGAVERAAPVSFGRGGVLGHEGRAGERDQEDRRSGVSHADQRLVGDRGGDLGPRFER